MTNDFSEAPASITLDVITPKGFPALFTVRDEKIGGLVTNPKSEDEIGLLQKISLLEVKLVEQGYKPQLKTFGVKKEIEYVKDASGKQLPCPTCEVGHIKVIHSAKGTFYGCDQSKFNPATKTYEGCKYFTGEDPSKTVKPTGKEVNEAEDPMPPEDY